MGSSQSERELVEGIKDMSKKLNDVRFYQHFTFLGIVILFILWLIK